MTPEWDDLLHGDRWTSDATLWSEDDQDVRGREVGELADGIEAAIRATVPADGSGHVVRVRSASRLGCFAGQLAGWRAGVVVVADDGRLGPHELERVRPSATVSIDGHVPSRAEPVVVREEPVRGGPALPSDVVAVNFTSGSTGRRKAVAVTATNLGTLFGCRAFDDADGRPPVSGGFATPTYDGWWFDTWHAVAAGGTVVCLPSVDDDVFDWPLLVERYGIDRLLLPAAVLSTLVQSLPGALAGIPRIFSGGEEFRAATYHRAREAGLRSRFVNLYGPTEATFATHMYELPDPYTADSVPIGRPVGGCRQELRPVDGDDESFELVVRGPAVCPGYLDDGILAESFGSPGTERSFHTGDLVRLDPDGEVVYRGRRDSRIKVNGMRVDADELTKEVLRLDGVTDCRVVTGPTEVCAVVLAPSPRDVDRDEVDRVVRGFSHAIPVRMVERLPVRSGGKVDVAALINESEGDT